MDFLVMKDKPPEEFRPIKVEIMLNTKEEAREFQARMHMSLKQVRTGLNGYFSNYQSLCGPNSLMCNITSFRRHLAGQMGKDSLLDD